MSIKLLLSEAEMAQCVNKSAQHLGTVVQRYAIAGLMLPSVMNACTDNQRLLTKPQLSKVKLSKMASIT